MSLDGMRRHQIGHGLRVRRSARAAPTFGLRSWAEVARLYRMRSGEAISDGAVKECGLRAMRRLRLLLLEDAEIREAVGLEPPADQDATTKERRHG